jgi:hypothetical protein
VDDSVLAASSHHGALNLPFDPQILCGCQKLDGVME